ncbi:MAG TPA: MauE/DoxX family redox-associated membrane protein [Verrucomicrobiae bacterium]|nr:MauE/DoxX family redox-associated membrane protein [Verrucomicrobiae bacterium]
MTNHYTVKGMRCENCVQTIEKALSQISEIESAAVTLNPPEATITMRQAIDLERLNQAVKKAGDYSLEGKGDAKKPASPSSSPNGEAPISYWPLILVFTYLAGAMVLREFYLGRWDGREMMENFMGGFFLIFSFFKMLNLRGFAASYASYDVIAKRWMSYGYVYAFIELGLGLAYLFRLNPFAVNIVTLIVMSISSIGVIQSLLKKQKIQCACLGTVFNLPMSFVTLVEDLLMVAMAILMLTVWHK